MNLQGAKTAPVAARWALLLGKKDTIPPSAIGGGINGRLDSFDIVLPTVSNLSTGCRKKPRAADPLFRRPLALWGAIVLSLTSKNLSLNRPHRHAAIA